MTPPKESAFDAGATDRLSVIDGLVAGLAHDINTPMGVGLTASTYLVDLVDSFSQALRAGGLSESAREEYLTDIAESATLVARNIRRAADIVRNFKALPTSSRLRDGRLSR